MSKKAERKAANVSEQDSSWAYDCSLLLGIAHDARLLIRNFVATGKLDDNLFVDLCHSLRDYEAFASGIVDEDALKFYERLRDEAEKQNWREEREAQLTEVK